ncbi:MAG: 4Fe-4S binding protein [Eubacteriales bacterium]
MKKLLILSGKGGTGKTTTAAAFIHFSEANAFADCDVDAPNLHLVTSTSTTDNILATSPVVSDFYGSKKAFLDPTKCIQCGLCFQSCRFHAIQLISEQYSVSEYHCEGCGVCEYVCPHSAITLQDDIAGTLTLHTTPAIFSTAKLKMGRGNSGKLVTAVKSQLTTACSSDSSNRKLDIAIIDGSPGIGCPVIASVSGVDLVLIVTEPTLSGMSDMERIVKTASILQTNVAVCVNKWDTSEENTERIELFCQEHELAYVGRIPYDKQASLAINSAKTLAEIDCPASNALQKVYHEVIHLLSSTNARTN